MPAGSDNAQSRPPLLHDEARRCRKGAAGCRHAIDHPDVRAPVFATDIEDLVAAPRVEEPAMRIASRQRFSHGLAPMLAYFEELAHQDR